MWWIINRIDLSDEEEFIDFNSIRKYFTKTKKESYVRVKINNAKREAE